MTRSATIRILFFSTWLDGGEDAGDYLRTLPERDLASRVSDPGDAGILRMARLDRDWDGECLRSFASMEHPALRFLPARIVGARGLLEFTAAADSFEGSVPWLLLIDQKPAAFAPVIGRLLSMFRARGGRVLYWAYDEASRNMDCFAAGVAPHLDVLIHDESPLEPAVAGALRPGCRTLHSSWVANVVPYGYEFREDVDNRIVFLGSKLGLTPHRAEQIRALERHFGDRFFWIADHSVPVAERGRFAGIKVHFCPEGRKFDTPGMSASHTDRPFWAGCMGQVPVIEDSRTGGRLEALVREGLLYRYSWGDARGAIDACERALAADVEKRRAIYDDFNRNGTVGPIAAAEIARELFP